MEKAKRGRKKQDADKPGFVKAFEQDQQEEKELRNLFDIDDMLAIQRVTIEELGIYVDYAPLIVEERTEVFRVTDNNPVVQRDLQNRKELYLMLKKANPNITEDIVNHMRVEYLDAVLIQIRQRQQRFLLPLMKNVLAGSNQIIKQIEQS